MFENMSNSREGRPVRGARIFIDEMLSYVHLEYYGISRESFIPMIYRNMYREIVDFNFNRDVGAAVVKILRWLVQNQTEELETAVEYELLQPTAPVFLAHLLESHDMVRQTDEDFRRDYNVWGSCLLHWFAVLAGVCFFLERNGNWNGLLRVLAVAGLILRNKMSGTPSTKMMFLSHIARRIISAL